MFIGNVSAEIAGAEDACSEVLTLNEAIFKGAHSLGGARMSAQNTAIAAAPNTAAVPNLIAFTKRSVFFISCTLPYNIPKVYFLLYFTISNTHCQAVDYFIKMWYNIIVILEFCRLWIESEVSRLNEIPESKMRCFFHADNSDYDRALAHTLTLVIIPLFAICIFCTVNYILHYDAGLSRLFAIIIGASVLFGMIFTFSAVYIVDKKKRRHSRFTYLDILPQGLVFSEYAGEFIRYGDRIILRRLYYLSFADLESISRNPKKAPHDITIKGKFRFYFYDSERLGYHIEESGNLVFDTDILNIGMYDDVSELTIKKHLGNTRLLEASILYFKDKFDNIPEKKPFSISDFVAVRKRRKPRTSNPALEAPSFNRNWK